MIFEHASVIECHQDGLIPDPESWIFAWILLSIVSSIVVLCIIGTDELLNVHCDKLKGAFRKGSFISFTLLSMATIAYYFLRVFKIDELSGINLATSITLIFWPLVIWGVVWVFNYVLPVEKANYCSISCMFYWTALIMYLLETGFKLFAAMLDAAYDIAPAFEIHVQVPEESLKGFIVILPGLRLAFHTRLFLFFWNKIFHGDKNLFSEPCSKLEGRQRSPRSQLEDRATTSLLPKEVTATSTDERQDGSTSTHIEGEHGTSSISEVRPTVPPRPPAAKLERPPVPKKNEKKYATAPPGKVDPTKYKLKSTPTKSKNEQEKSNPSV